MLFTAAAHWKQSTCPLPVGRVNQAQCADTMEHHTATRMKEQQAASDGSADAHKYSDELKKPVTQAASTQDEPLYAAFRHWPNRALVLDVTVMVILEVGSEWKEINGACSGNVLFPDTGSGYAGVLPLKIHQSIHFTGFCPSLYVQYNSVGTVGTY